MQKEKKPDKQRRKDAKKLMKRATKFVAAQDEHDQMSPRKVLKIYRIQPTEYRKILQKYKFWI